MPTGPTSDPCPPPVGPLGRGQSGCNRDRPSIPRRKDSSTVAKIAELNSLQIEWSGIKTTETANQPANRMRGTFVETSATIALTATTPKSMVTALSNGHGFRFVSDPASTSVNDFALMGHEQNGVYF